MSTRTDLYIKEKYGPKNVIHSKELHKTQALQKMIEIEKEFDRLSESVILLLKKNFIETPYRFSSKEEKQLFNKIITVPLLYRFKEPLLEVRVIIHDDGTWDYIKSAWDDEYELFTIPKKEHELFLAQRLEEKLSLYGVECCHNHEIQRIFTDKAFEIIDFYNK